MTMDGISGVIAVVSMAAQLGNGIKVLCNLVDSIEEAPKEIKSVVRELNLLRTILEDIKMNEETFGPHPATLMALEGCLEITNSMSSIASSLAQGLCSTSKIRRKWTAIETIGQGDKISLFKAKLQEAKLTLIMAQQTSATRTSRIHFQTYQRSLDALSQSVINLSRTTSYQSEKVALGASDEKTILNAFASEIERISSSWPVGPFQGVLETELRNATGKTMESMSEKQITPYLAIIPCNNAYRRVRRHHLNKFPTGLGEIRCSVTEYQIMRGADFRDASSTELETETSFNFIPSRWMIRLGISHSVRFDILRLSTRGWDTKLRTFNIVPRNSPILEFCREGNIPAVQRLISNKQASVYDMTEFGETPLHIAASRSQAELCAVLLQQGADRNVRDLTGFRRTPFACASWPCEVRNIGSLTSTRTTPTKIVQTLREFLNTGDCFEDRTERTVSRLISYISHSAESEENPNSQSPSLWIIKDVIPVTNPYILDQDFWQDCLQAATITPSMNEVDSALFAEIIRHCEISTVRSAFVFWTTSLDRPHQSKESVLEIFQFLASGLGNICFLHAERGKRFSSLCYTRQYSVSFWRFRDLLRQSNFDIRDIVKKEVEIDESGWTEESLLSLFNDSDPLVPVYMFSRLYCDKRFKSWPCTFRTEVPWKRKLQRLKNGIDLNAPLTDEEQREQEEWDQFLETVRYVCEDCGGWRSMPELDDEIYEEAPWAPALGHKENWDDWWI